MFDLINLNEFIFRASVAAGWPEKDVTKRWFWPVKVGTHVVNIKDEDCVMASLMLIWVTRLRTWGFSSLSRSGRTDLRNRQDLILYVFLCSSSSVIIFRLSEHLFIQQSYLTFFSTFRSINSSLVGLGLALIQTCLHLLGVVRGAVKKKPVYLQTLSK